MDTKKIDKKTIFMISIATLLFFYMGFRDISIGPDTKSYWNDFNKYRFYSWPEIFNLGTNYFFYVFNKLLTYIIPNNYTIYLMIVSLIISISTYVFLKKFSKDFLLSYIMLISLEFIFFYMSGIKQTLAIAFILVSFRYLQEGNYFKYFLYLIIASLFHNTALIFILAFLIKFLKFNKIYLFCLPFLLLVIYRNQYSIFLFLRNILGEDFYPQYGNNYQSSLNLSGFIIQCLIFMFSIFLLFPKIKRDKNIQYLLILTSLGLLFQVMTKSLAEFSRISMYFSIFQVILLPLAINESFIKEKYIINLMVYTLFILYFIFFSSQNPAFMPYKLFFC